MRLNASAQLKRDLTHEGAPAKAMTPMQALRRSVMSAMLWEKEFYEDGEEIAVRIERLSRDVSVAELADLAVEVRTVAKLRHMPLLLISILSKRASGNPIVAETIAKVLRRPDEMPELLAVHAHLNGVAPNAMKRIIPAQMKKGISSVFGRFDAYQLAKYDREGPIRLKDVMFLTHPKPANDGQKEIWERLMSGTLPAPDTWEVALSGGADKKEAFTRLLTEGKLGYLALLRNLRNMLEAGVDEKLVRDAILARKGAGDILPFRFTAAARACPRMEGALDEALSQTILEMPRLDGRTILLVDVSGSMDAKLSARSDMSRADAAATLGAVIHGDLRVFSFSEEIREVPARRGMAGVDAILRSQPHFGTELGKAVNYANTQPHDRLIVITDEQSQTKVPDPVAKRAYMINVASARNGVGYGRWTHIDGFSENVLRFIHEIEARDAGAV